MDTPKAPFGRRLGAELRDGILDLGFALTPVGGIRALMAKVILGRCGRHVAIARGVVLRKVGNIEVGGNVVINTGCILDARGGKLEIGNNVDISREVNIWTLSHDTRACDHRTKGGNVTIEDHVWIASRATILPGVRVGRGAVVGAGAVVSKDVGECEVVAGNPARRIGRRNCVPEYNLQFTFIF